MFECYVVVEGEVVDGVGFEVECVDEFVDIVDEVFLCEWLGGMWIVIEVWVVGGDDVVVGVCE